MEASNIDVLLPEVKFFIDKIENNQSFHFLRANHGIIDLYCERYVMCDTKVLPFENFEKVYDALPLHKNVLIHRSDNICILIHYK